MKRKGGWHRESLRHSLARRGIKTGKKKMKKSAKKEELSQWCERRDCVHNDYPFCGLKRPRITSVGHICLSYKKKHEKEGR